MAEQATSVKHSVTGPDTYPGQVVVMPGSTIEWINESEYPAIEIIFAGAKPVSDEGSFTGTTKDPIVMHLSGTEGVYLYTVHYKASPGKKCARTGPHALFVNGCFGCQNP